MLPDAEPTLQVKTRRQLRVLFMSSSCSLHSSLSSLTQHLPLSPLFVAVRLIVSSRLPSCFLLAAPGCDQRLQLGVHAALQLDSRHHGPQPPHRLQSHPLWVRSAKKKMMGIANTHAPPRMEATVAGVVRVGLLLRRGSMLSVPCKESIFCEALRPRCR